MDHLSRRQFLKAMTMAAGASLPLACIRDDRPVAVSEPAALPVRMLGKTGVAVTIAGLGCAWAGEMTQANARKIFDAALDSGIRYFDTAPNYSRSEEFLGPALRDCRDDVFIATKLDHVPYGDAEADLHQSLKRLKTDHVDLLLLHGVGLPNDFRNADAILADDGALRLARKARKEGLTRFIGMSVHGPNAPAMKVLNNADDLDVVMPFINNMAMREKDPDGSVVQRCIDSGIGIVAMKVLGGSGQENLVPDYDAAFRFALGVPAVACAVVGVRTPQEVRRLAQAARRFRPLTQQERDAMLEQGARLIETDASAYALLRRHCGADHCLPA